VPERAGWVLASLILVAAVANLNLAVANVALPDIGKHFDSGQTTLDLIAVGYSLGLACSVLWLGALGDRYGRKTMAVGGTILAVPFSLLAAFSPSDTVLFLARLGGGLAADWRRIGISDHARLDHCAVVRPRTYQIDRAVVGPRRFD
jgi:MFS transporter, DHA2 family, multidrug resistance protein